MTERSQTLGPAARFGRRSDERRRAILVLPAWSERCTAGPYLARAGQRARYPVSRRSKERKPAARSTMATAGGRFEPPPWPFRPRQRGNGPELVRVRPRPLGAVSPAPSTIRGARLRHPSTRSYSTTSRRSWLGRPRPTPWATNCRSGSSGTSGVTWSAESWPMASPGPAVRIAATSG